MKQSVEEVLAGLGCLGRTQLITTAIFSLYQFIACVVAFCVSIILKVPEWECISDHCQEKVSHLPSRSAAFCSLVPTDYKWTDRSNIASEYGIYCSNSYLAALSITYYFVGYAVGTTSMGVLADRYGRKRMVVPALCLYTGITALVASSTSYTQFLVLRCITGLIHGGLQNVTHVYQAELIPPKYRNACNTVKEGTFGLGLCLSAIMIYWIPSWRSIFVILAFLLGTVTLVVYYLLPESPIHLAGIGDMDKAMRALQKIATVNRTQLPKNVALEHSQKEISAPKESIMGIFSLSFAGKIGLVAVIYLFFATTLLMYCLSYHVAAVPGDVYYNSFMMGLSAGPAYYCLYRYGDKYGRRKCLIYLYLIAIGTLFVSWFDAAGTPLFGRITVQLLGFVTARSCMLGISSLMYLYTTELYPSSARAGLTGLSSMIARVGAIMSSYVLVLDAYDPSLVYIICIVSGLLALALLVTTLPDTSGTALPATFADTDILLAKGKVHYTQHEQNSV